MDLKILQEFVCLSKDLSFTKTAKRCYVSQSVLSRHIQALESELGYQLLIRDKKGIRLTPYGEVFAESCKRIDAEYTKVLSQLDGIDEGYSQILRVSYTSPLPYGYIDAIYDAYLEQCPDVKLDLKTSWEENILKLLEQDKVDVAICISFDEPDEDRYSSMVLFEDQYVALLPSDHALSTSKSMYIKDLESELVLIPSSHDYPMQSMRIMEIVNELPKLKVRADLNNKHAAVSLASAHRGVALIRKILLNGMNLHSLTMVPISDESLKLNVLAVWKKSNKSKAVSGFVNVLEELKKQ